MYQGTIRLAMLHRFIGQDRTLLAEDNLQQNLEHWSTGEYCYWDTTKGFESQRQPYLHLLPFRALIKLLTWLSVHAGAIN